MSGITAIQYIQALPGGPYNGTGTVGIIITNGVPNYFNVVGANLDNIVSVTWYPINPSSLKFTTRQFLLVSSTQGTFGITVLDNYLNDCNRGGYISFLLNDGTNLVFPVITYGRLSLTPLWTASDQGLSTGS
jgi:hypothetical protein